MHMKSLPDVWNALYALGFGNSRSKTFYDPRMTVGISHSGNDVIYHIYVLEQHKPGHDLTEFLKGKLSDYDNIRVRHTGRIRALSA